MAAGGNLHRHRRRRGYTVRYTGDDATYDTRPQQILEKRAAGRQRTLSSCLTRAVTAGIVAADRLAHQCTTPLPEWRSLLN